MNTKSSKKEKRTKGTSGKSGKTAKDAFIKKIDTCLKIFDYKDETKDVKGKNERLAAINELQNLLQDQKSVVQLIVPNLDHCIHMIEKNIFRCLPNVKKSNLAFSETGIEQEEESDPAWPHLQGIYEFFLQLIINEAVEVRVHFTVALMQVKRALAFLLSFLSVPLKGFVLGKTVKRLRHSRIR